MKLLTANKYLPIALALAAFAAGTAPALAGTWSAGVSARNIRPYAQTSSINDSGYSAHAQVPATIHQQSDLGSTVRFGAGSQS